MKTIWLPQVIVTPFLLWALKPHNPYAYFTLLRWICCGIFAYLAFRAMELKKREWMWVLGFTALLYNPFMRVHLNREIWSVINMATVIVALGSVRGLRSLRRN